MSYVQEYGIDGTGQMKCDSSTSKKEYASRKSNPNYADINDRDYANASAVQIQDYSININSEDIKIKNEPPSTVISVALNKSEEPSLHVIDQISYLKEQSDDDEDLCQIDKVTTERSRSRSRLRR